MKWKEQFLLNHNNIDFGSLVRSTIDPRTRTNGQQDVEQPEGLNGYSVKHAGLKNSLQNKSSSRTSSSDVKIVGNLLEKESDNQSVIGLQVNLSLRSFAC